jgi:hypothetical protein
LNIEKQSFEVSAFRFDRDDFRARTSGGSHKHRKQADIRTYIHTDKFAFPRPSRIDFPGQCSKFGRLVHLRGEQQVHLATVINRVQPQAHPPPIDIKRASRVFEPHRRYSAQQDREAQAKSVVWHSRGQRDHASIENTWRRAAEFIRVRQICHGVRPLYAADRQLAGSKSQKLICGWRRLNFRLRRFILCAPE